MVLRKLSQSFKISLAVMLSVLSSGILQAAPAYAADDKQVFCNIQGASGSWKAQIGGPNTEHEYPLLQNGQPVFVNNQSQVTALDTACAQQYGTVSVTTTPTATDPTCEADGQLVVPVIANITWTGGVNGDGPGTYTLVATANTGYTLTGQSQWTVEVLPQLTGEDCDEEPTVVPVSPLITRVHQTSVCDQEEEVVTSGSITVTAVEGLHYWLNGMELTGTEELEPGTYQIALTTDAGFELATGVTSPVSITVNAAETLECESQATDLCSNIAGNQTTLPDYVTIRGNDRCVVTICHRTNSVTNPYVVQTPDANAVDGDTGNNTGQGDHYAEHQGPAFDPNTVYPTPHNGDQWGDIIPAVPGLTPGLNWDANGQATYNNECTPTEAGTPNVTVSAVCVPNGVKVTLTNTGNADGNATINGTPYSVPASDSVEVTLPFGIATPFQTAVTVTINGVTTTQIVNCAPGQGGGQTLGDTTTKTPTTPQVLGTTTELPAALPSTGGEQNPMLILLASLMAYGIAYLFQGRRQLTQNRA